MSAVSSARDAPVKARGLRQTMSDLHIWVGLLAGWLLYAMFLTGTASYFRNEISQWMRPELPAQREVPDAADVAQRVVGTLSTLAAGSPQWSIQLPDRRYNVANAFWNVPRVPGRRGFESAIFDPATGAKTAGRETRGGDFFYAFHYQFHYMPVLWGRWLAGLCAMFMLVAIVSGVITHKKIFVDFFTFRWGKGQRSWLDAHNALSVFGLPFHLMITYSGLVTLMLLYMPWGSDAAFRTPAERQALLAEMSAFPPAGRPRGEKADLASVADMVRQGQARWGRDEVGRVTINNPGDAAARVTVVRDDSGRVSVNPEYMMFDGTTGGLLQVKDRVGGAAAETRGVVYALHLGRFADTVVRWLYFLVSFAGTAMVATGLVLWTAKRRAKLPDPDRPYFGLRLVERLNIAAVAGLPLAMAAFLWANRLLPSGMTGRADWEIHLFFIVWALTLTYAVLRPRRRAWVELLWANCAALATLPLTNVVMGRGLPGSLLSGDWVFAGFDLSLLALALFAAILARRTAAHRPGRAGARRRPTTAEDAA